MGLVSQEPVLFNDTVRTNIAYGKGGNATESEIVAAAELANVHQFVSSLPQVSFYTLSWNGLKFAMLYAISVVQSMKFQSSNN
jgi:ABC-type multidrug transport system fused ATPase/permease subunit